MCQASASGCSQRSRLPPEGRRARPAPAAAALRITPALYLGLGMCRQGFIPTTNKTATSPANYGRRGQMLICQRCKYVRSRAAFSPEIKHSSAKRSKWDYADVTKKHCGTWMSRCRSANVIYSRQCVVVFSWPRYHACHVKFPSNLWWKLPDVTSCLNITGNRFISIFLIS